MKTAAEYKLALHDIRLVDPMLDPRDPPGHEDGMTERDLSKIGPAIREFGVAFDDALESVDHLRTECKTIGCDFVTNARDGLCRSC